MDSTPRRSISVTARLLNDLLGESSAAHDLDYVDIHLVTDLCAWYENDEAAYAGDAVALSADILDLHVVSLTLLDRGRNS